MSRKNKRSASRAEGNGESVSGEVAAVPFPLEEGPCACGHRRRCHQGCAQYVDAKLASGYYWIKCEGQVCVGEFTADGRGCSPEGPHWHVPLSEECVSEARVKQVMGGRIAEPAARGPLMAEVSVMVRDEATNTAVVACLRALVEELPCKCRGGEVRYTCRRCEALAA